MRRNITDKILLGMKNKKNITVFKRTEFIQSRELKSRRDGILLTVDFNLRTEYASCALQSPTGTMLPPHWGRVGVGLVSSLQDLLMIWQQ